MAKLPTWNGYQGLVEQPDSPKKVTDPTKTALTRIYEGPYAVCLASEPAVGQTFSDLPGDVVVVGSSVEKMPGGKARLTINFETPYETTFETEWVEIDKPLILNPRYWDGSTADTTPAGPYPLTLSDKAMIEKWEAEDDFILKGPSVLGGPGYCFKVLQGTTVGAGAFTPIRTNQNVSGYVGSFNIYQLSYNAQDYAAKRLKGEEGFRIWAPVVRQTSETLDPPEATACGLLQGPPPEANAPTNEFTGAAYAWQKSAQRVTRTGPYGKYRFQLEWQGADRIDSDLYGTADPGTAPNPPS